MVSNWKFDSEVTNIFDTHVREHVPIYEDMHNFITEVSSWFIDEDSNFYDIGCSTGELISNIYKKHPEGFKKMIGIDISKDMYKNCSKRFKDYEKVEIYNNNVKSENFEIKNANLIGCVLTLMFTRINDRSEIIKKIYDGLNKGGAFILVEKIVTENSRFNEMWSDMYHDSKIKKGVSVEKVFEKSRSIRGVLKPLTIKENLCMLEAVGFEQNEVFFKWGNFCGIIAIK